MLSGRGVLHNPDCHHEHHRAEVYDTKYHPNMDMIAKQYSEMQNKLDSVFLVMFLTCVICGLLSISTLWVAIALKTKPTEEVRIFLRRYKAGTTMMMPVIAVVMGFSLLFEGQI